MKINGTIGESHLKNKTEQPAWKEQNADKDMEYQTIKSHWCVLILQYPITDFMDIKIHKI